MRKIGSVVTIVLFFAIWSYAQFQISEIVKVKEIKLLESTVFDVQRIMVGFETDGWEAGDLEQSFSTDNFSIDISYSSGECYKDDEIWKAKQWTVTKITIEPDESLKVKDLSLDLTKFKKEQLYAEYKHVFIYHDKTKGVAYKINDKQSEIEQIILVPPKDSKVGVCENKRAKEFVSSDSWFGTKELEDRHPPGDINQPANVTDISLSETEILSTTYARQIHVKTQAVDPENDVLTYQYIISGGKIIGTGAEVIWDLTGVPVGTYTITAGVDDGCGICGKTVTNSVTIK